MHAGAANASPARRAGRTANVTPASRRRRRAARCPTALSPLPPTSTSPAPRTRHLGRSDTRATPRSHAISINLNYPELPD